MPNKITDAGAQLSGGLWVTTGESVEVPVLAEALTLDVADDSVTLAIDDDDVTLEVETE